jgi:hypothetical protein
MQLQVYLVQPANFERIFIIRDLKAKSVPSQSHTEAHNITILYWLVKSLESRVFVGAVAQRQS